MVLQLFLIHVSFNGVVILILFFKYFFYQNNHLQLFLIHVYFNGGVILILFSKYFFIKITIKPQLETVVFNFYKYS